MSVFVQFLDRMKVSPSVPATEEAVATFESRTGLMLTPSLKDLYLATDGVVLRKDLLEIMSLAKVTQFLLGDEACAPFTEYGLSTRLGYFPLTESFESNPVCVCCDDVLEGYIVHAFHDGEPNLVFRNLENFLNAIADKVSRVGWDWDLQDLQPDFEDDFRTDADTLAGQALMQVVIENHAERDTEILPFSMQLLRGHVNDFIENCLGILAKAGIKTTIHRSRKGPFLCLDDGPVWMDTESLYSQSLSDTNFATILVEQARRSLDERNRNKAQFSVILTDIGANRLEVMKVVRDTLALGLKEAKELVESLPRTLKDNIRLVEAEKIKHKLEDSGAKVEIK